MKFGINTFIWSLTYDDAVEQVLPLIREKGFDGIEVAVFRARNCRRSESAGQRKLKVSNATHAPCWSMA